MPYLSASWRTSRGELPLDELARARRRAASARPAGRPRFADSLRAALGGRVGLPGRCRLRLRRTRSVIWFAAVLTKVPGPNTTRAGFSFGELGAAGRELREALGGHVAGQAALELDQPPEVGRQHRALEVALDEDDDRLVAEVVLEALGVLERSASPRHERLGAGARLEAQREARHRRARARHAPRWHQRPPRDGPHQPLEHLSPQHALSLGTATEREQASGFSCGNFPAGRPGGRGCACSRHGGATGPVAVNTNSSIGRAAPAASSGPIGPSEARPGRRDLARYLPNTGRPCGSWL